MLYLEEHYDKIEVSQRHANYGRNACGYGNRIATPYLVRLAGNGPWRRVYAVCHSNVASHYVVVKGQAYYVKYSYTLKG